MAIVQLFKNDKLLQHRKIIGEFWRKGELILLHNLGKKTALKGLEVLYIEVMKEEMLPYFIQTARIKSEEEIFLKLDGVDTREAAQKLAQKEVWLPLEDFHKIRRQNIPFFFTGISYFFQKEQILGKCWK